MSYELWSPSLSRVAGLMLSQPTLLCMSEIMTWRQADEGSGRSEVERHELAASSRDIISNTRRQ